ncbi:hypothetical protein NIES4071_43090 [Calothrix sp. NIES-4071]|nr:hypothetical protein NIES4071_43090 [Calothrix sp. NIES-4071]BAZ58623.1 hypothetical protein NIES4105_43020 [Calothrix sp. NIES-4105]
MFAPIVILTRNCLGQVKFNKLRGKLIAVHAQVIVHFCDYFHISHITRQNLIRLARDNGKRLGFLA